MAHYAYKHACYDIDYEKFKQLVKQFEQEEGRKHNGDSNYYGDNWYIMAMWIKELRAKVTELESRASPASVPELTDAQIDRLLSVRVPGGSEARDWFLPHENDKGLANVRQVVRLILAAAPTPPVSEDRKDAERYHKLANYMIGTRFDIDDALVAASSIDEISSILDAMQEDKP